MAVARGAVIFGMHPTKVATRIPRHWYGIEITNVFEPEIDPEEYKIYRPDGSIRCDNRFSTYVERGKPLGKYRGSNLFIYFKLKHDLVRY
jgi:hypothetical protein